MPKDNAKKELLPPARRRHARPVTKDDFPILERLLGASGACGGCWCMYWRVPSMGNYWTAHKGAKKSAFRKPLARAIPLLKHHPAFRRMRVMAGRAPPDYIDDEFEAPQFQPRVTASPNNKTASNISPRLRTPS